MAKPYAKPIHVPFITIYLHAIMAFAHSKTVQAQIATQAPDEALDNMQDWMSDFIAIARFALASEPQLLEMLGIVEPS